VTEQNQFKLILTQLKIINIFVL